MFKKTLLTIWILFLTFTFNTAYAVECSGINPETIEAAQILCPIQRVFNAIILLAGIFLAIMVLWGAQKLALSFGNPDKLKSAVDTWKFALLGFLIIVGAISIYSIIRTALGIGGFVGPQEIFDSISSEIQSLLDTFVLK